MADTSVREEWKPVADFDGRYFVSSRGRIRNCDTGLILKTGTANGYPVVSIQGGGRRRVAKVHRLVAESFMEADETRPHINHINGVKHDNRLENLEWTTRSENQKHAVRSGLQGRIALNEAKVCVIRRALGMGMTQAYIASVFGVCRQAIGDIATGRSWSGVANLNAVSAAIMAAGGGK